MRNAIVLGMPLLLLACAPAYTPTQEKLLVKMANRRLTCQEGRDCEVKWNRAIEWVTVHSSYPMRTVSANLIQTHDMVSDTGRPTVRHPYYSVVRYKISADQYEMRFDAACDEVFKCRGSVLKTHADFANAIIGLPEGVIRTGPESYRVDKDRL